MRLFLRICYILAGLVTGLLVMLLALLLIQSTGNPRPFLDSKGKVIPGSIAVIETVNINGFNQKMIIRGRDTTKPVLLYLHGGPGSPEFPFVREYNSGIEDLFVVCYWEQRGAGMSYSKNIKPEMMTLPVFIEDTHEVSEYLIHKFKREKIFLIGHSWGTMLGAFTVQKYPDLFFAFIAVGQVGRQELSEQISYKFVLSKAVESNDRRIIRLLKKAGPPPYSDPDESLSNLVIERKLVTKYRGAIKKGDLYTGAAKALFSCREYTINDKINYLRGMKFTLRYFWAPIMKSDLFRDIPEQKIPVYIMQGKSDYQTAYVVAKDYFDSLQAPFKKFYTFERSAHSPIFEEPYKFEQILKEIVSERSSSSGNPNK